jgi:hypothetical protein
VCTLTAEQLREVVVRSRETSIRTINTAVHRYIDQADPEQARRGLQFVCAQGLVADTFVEYLDAELMALRSRLQAEGVLDAEGRLMTEMGEGWSLTP